MYYNGHRCVPRPTGDRSPSPAPKTTPRGGRHTRPPRRRLRRRRRRPRRRRDCERVKRFRRAVSIAIARTTCSFRRIRFTPQIKPDLIYYYYYRRVSLNITTYDRLQSRETISQHSRYLLILVVGRYMSTVEPFDVQYSNIHSRLV